MEWLFTILHFEFLILYYAMVQSGDYFERSLDPRNMRGDHDEEGFCTYRFDLNTRKDNMENETEIIQETEDKTASADLDMPITTVIIDTVAFRDANSDFVGLNSQLLPSFFDLIEEKDFLLLNHPILKKEIYKHILDSKIVQNHQSLITYFEKCEKLLRMENIYDESYINCIVSIDVRDMLYKKYLEYYSRAEELDYPDIKAVFDKYFKNVPPFAESGKKKYEFPDACVIESTLDYLNKHPNDRLLVISRDDDWEKSFAGLDSVIVEDSIESALTRLNLLDSVLSEEMISSILSAAYDDICTNLMNKLEREDYDFPDYEFEDYFSYDSIDITDISEDYVPLVIKRNKLLINTEISIEVSGSGVIADYTYASWDNEDKQYYGVETADFTVSDGYGEVPVEIELSFDLDNLDSPTVESVKLLNIGSIDLYSDDPEIVPVDYEDDDDEPSDEDEEYYTICPKCGKKLSASTDFGGFCYDCSLNE